MKSHRELFLSDTVKPLSMIITDSRGIYISVFAYTVRLDF